MFDVCHFSFFLAVPYTHCTGVNWYSCRDYTTVNLQYVYNAKEATHTETTEKPMMKLRLSVSEVWYCSKWSQTEVKTHTLETKFVINIELSHTFGWKKYRGEPNGFRMFISHFFQCFCCWSSSRDTLNCILPFIDDKTIIQHSLFLPFRWDFVGIWFYMLKEESTLFDFLSLSWLCW